MQEIAARVAITRRNIFNPLNCSSSFCRIVVEELFKIFNDGLTHWPFKISTVWKCSNNGPGGFGGGRIVNRGGGGRRCKSSFFI